MQALLQKASHALSVNDAGTLEELAGAASVITALPLEADLAAIARSAEVLRQQVRSASGHLQLRRRLEARSGLGGSLWAL